MHPTLARYLQQSCGLASPEALREALGGVSALLADAGAAPPSASVALLAGLPDLLARLDAGFGQADTDVESRSRHMRSSAAELTAVSVPRRLPERRRSMLP